MAVLKKLATDGHNIIIYTARPRDDRKVTEKWLKENNIPHDTVIFGKLRADLYIDQNSKRMEEL